MSREIEYLRLSSGDEHTLHRIADGVFDGPIDSRWTGEFLTDPRHHMVVALDGDTVVGMVSGVVYVHPDKAPQLWINELGVAPAHQRRGIGSRLVQEILAIGRAEHCTEAWVGTEPENIAARKVYERVGGAAEEFVLYFMALDHRTGQNPT